ncbi:MAG: hypothetical protein GXY85_01485 [Candidatus Brocadiaceae bacterium]|nr:hypothetical protein [Candidatus Brocadiaceae bacterium]
MFTGVRSIRSVVVLLSVVAALAASVGCAATRPPDHAAEVRLSLDSATYARGEPVRAAVSVTNVGACDLLVPSLDNDGLKFRRGRPGVGELLVRRPVLPNQAAGQPRLISPGESTGRTFLFCDLTDEAGEWGLMVGLSGCRGAEAGSPPLSTCYSEPAPFAVSHERMFERDPYSGIVVRRQAVALAREKGGADGTVPARAVLVPLGETGLYVWVVLLGAEDDPLSAPAAFTVNAYSGVVKALEIGESPQERTD